MKRVFGVDISKSYFDVVDEEGSHWQFSNDAAGFEKFLKLLSSESLVVMEATGYYHHGLAQFLCRKHIRVAAVNPLSVKRFLQMKLSRIKTDKTDAQGICEYALRNEVRLYTAREAWQVESSQLLSLQELWLKQRTAIRNRLHGEEVLGFPSEAVCNSLLKMLESIDAELKSLEEKLESLILDERREQLELLTSIPGIGKKTAILLIVMTRGFTSFQNSRQLSCYAGITPVIRTSGSSIRGRSRISKTGNGKLRNLLFLCSFSASKLNKSCKELYDRIVARGKSKKLALIAVSNKLLKQAFAVINSGGAYDPEYRSKYCGATCPVSVS